MTGTAARPWLVYAVTTVVLWGVWGALAGLSAQHGFPDTLVYCVWALTMILPAAVVMRQAGWQLDRTPRAIAHGMLIGLLGAGGQLVLFKALTLGPAYYIFPIISLSPVITIALSYLLLRERTTRLGALGVVLALVALPMLDFSVGEGHLGDWFVMAIVIMAAWGVQAYVMKIANAHMRAESIFFYMMVGGLLLVPVAWAMTDFAKPINTGLTGPWMTAAIQLLNAVGALTLVFAFRHGKAIIVAPLTNAGAPLITAVLSLLFAGVVPGPLKIVGLVLALVASLLLALEPEREPAAPLPDGP